MIWRIFGAPGAGTSTSADTPRTDTEACLPSFPAQVVLAVPGHAMGLPVGLAFS